MEFDPLSKEILGCAIEVHRVLGPGLLESVYEECLTHELLMSGIYIERQKPVPIFYKDIRLDYGYRLDLLVENMIVVELKSVESICPVHLAQILTYMRLSNTGIGLLINFNVTVLKNGIRRFVF